MKIYLVQWGGDATHQDSAFGRALHKGGHPLILVSFMDPHYRKHVELVPQDTQPKEPQHEHRSQS